MGLDLLNMWAGTPSYDYLQCIGEQQKDGVCKVVICDDVIARVMAKNPKSMTIENGRRPLLTNQCRSFTPDITGRDPNRVFTVLTGGSHSAHPSRRVLAAR